MAEGLAKRDYTDENSYVYWQRTPGELYGFNVEYGYLEAIVRGFRSGFLTDNEYRQLGQCDSLEDFKLCFNDTDYVGVLETVDKETRLTTDAIAALCYDKFIGEFKFLRNQASGSLATFLNFIQYEYMIKNVMYLITGLIAKNDGKTLVEKVDKLGEFPRMASILTFDNTEEGFLDLYRTVLVDTPIGQYFENYFIEIRASSNDASLKQIKNIMEESEVEVIKERVQKYWLEDFYKYCQKLGGITAEVMLPLLEFRADMQAINIMLNSFDTSLNEPNERDTRQQLFCHFGGLYPNEISSMRNIRNVDELLNLLNKNGSSWIPLVQKAEERANNSDSGESWADIFPEVLREHEVKLNVLAFEQQSHFACFYSFVRLKMQEKDNIYWIAECINQKQRQQIDKYIAPFSLNMLS